MHHELTSRCIFLLMTLIFTQLLKNLCNTKVYYHVQKTSHSHPSCLGLIQPNVSHNTSFKSILNIILPALPNHSSCQSLWWVEYRVRTSFRHAYYRSQKLQRPSLDHNNNVKRTEDIVKLLCSTFQPQGISSFTMQNTDSSQLLKR